MSDSKPDNNKGPGRSKWLALVNIPVQMGVIIVGFSYLGTWLDGKYPNPKNIYFIIFTMLGVGLALYNVIRQVNQLNK